MARWRLTDGHYLYTIPETEWEYRETNRDTGRQARKTYEVPQYLHPKNQGDWNYPQDEMIVVADKFDPVYPRDIIFRGAPTPDMEPLDDEAKVISQGYVDRGEWKHPIESLNMTYSESRLSEFERGIAELLSKGVPRISESPSAMSTGGINPEAFERLQQQVTMLMEQNAKLEEQAKAPKRRL